MNNQTHIIPNVKSNSDIYDDDLEQILGPKKIVESFKTTGKYKYKNYEYYPHLLDKGINNIENDPKLQWYRCNNKLDKHITLEGNMLSVCNHCYDIVNHWINIGYDYIKISSL